MLKKDYGDVMDKLIKYLEGLSRLSLSDEERESLELNKITEYMSKLNELDTEGVDILSHSLDSYARLRDDDFEEFKDIHLIMENAPDSYENQFRVPKTV